MLCKFLGMKPVHFTNPQGLEVKGTTIYYAFKDEAIEGYAAEKAFLREDHKLPANLEPMEDVEITFNYRGKVIAVTKQILKPIQKS